MTGRKCSTCKHFEPAPIWRKGWCRNPLLYSPQQSHLVGEDDLDCERGMGNYWEAGDPALAAAPSSQTLGPVGADGFSESVSDAFANVTSSSTDDAMYVPPAAYDASPRAYAVSGGSIGDGDDLPPGGGGGGGNRQVGYYSDDRYWTDYLRIAAPIIGVLIMVGLFWFWAASFLGNDDNSNKGSVAGTMTALPTISASPAKGSPTRSAGATPTLTIVRTPSSNPTQTPGEANGPAPTEDTGGGGGGGDITNGATVQVFNTGGTGANMRADATTDSDIVATLLDGTQLTVTGDAVQDADGNTWWPVSGDDGDGYIVADYLEVVQ